MAGPAITRCSYEGLTVTADWDAVAATAPEYTVTVFNGVTALQSGTGSNGTGKVDLKGLLDRNNLNYTVAAAPGNGNSYGTALPVIASVLRHVTATMRGLDAIEVAWILPNSLPTGAHLKVENAQGSYGSGWIQGTSGVLTLSRPLEPTGSYLLKAAAGLPGSIGPWQWQAPLVVSAPPLAALTYDRTGPVLMLTLSEPPGDSAGPVGDAERPGGMEPGVVLFADGAPQATYVGDAGKQDFTARLPAPLDAAVHYTVRPFLRYGNATGPLGPEVTVLVSAPPVTGVRWVGANLEVGWAPLAAPPAPTGGLLGFAGPGSHPGPTVAAEATSWSGVPEPAFATGQSSAYTVTAANTRGVATGPMGDPLAVLVDTDALQSASYDGAVVRATWPAAGRPGATGARLLVLNGDSVVASVDAGGTAGGAAVAVALDAGQAYTAALQWTGDRSTGPIGPRTAALLTAPVMVTSVVTDPGTGLPTVSWPALTGPDPVTYQVQLLRDGQPEGAPIDASSVSLTLATPLVPGARQAVCVRALAAAGALLTGPFGPPLALPVGLPAVEALDYDGATALVRWHGAEGATGYAIDVVVDGTGERAGHAEAGPADRQLRVAVTPVPDPGKSWTVVVRALAGASSGPRATAPLVTPGLVPALDNVQGTPLPRLFRTSTLAATPRAITAYLPDLGITAASVPAHPPSGAPFVLAKNPDSVTSTAFPYTLTIAGAALSFAATDRATVRTSYDALLKEAEALTPTMTPRAVALVRDVIARLLPQTFAETLFYAYGLSNPGSAVDLRPGTILRVGSPPFQAIPGKPPDYAQGYAAGPATDFEIDDYVAGTSWLTGFDAFLSWLVANENLIVADPAHNPDWSVVSGAADPADLYYPGLRRSFYRLYLPQRLQGVTEPAASALVQQFTLLGADTYTAISGATPLSANVRGAAFRGRSVLRVCIRVRVDGTDQVVPVGTTVGNVLDRLGRRAPGTPPALRGVSLERALGAAVLDPAAYDAGASQPVRLGWRGAGFAPGADVLSLPLLPGDRLRTGDTR